MQIKIIDDCATIYDLPSGTSMDPVRRGEECADFYLVPDMIWQPDKGLADLVIASPDLQHRYGFILP